MTGHSSKDKLTAYQRWELASFDEPERVPQRANPAPEAEKPVQPEAQPAVVLPTAEEIERMFSDAHEQGYASGYEEGMAEARAKVKRLDALLGGLQQSLDELDQKIAEQLLATSIEIANQVIRQTLRIKPEFILPVVREAITILSPHQGHPALFAHPDDASLIRKQLGEQLAHNNWRIIDDSTLTPGGCRLEIGASEVDATLETRWRRVIESLGISQDWLDEMP